jgi:serine/threonine protein phosphatase PrpC
MTPKPREATRRPSNDDEQTARPFDYELDGGLDDEDPQPSRRRVTEAPTKQAAVPPKSRPVAKSELSIWGTGSDDIDLPPSEEEKTSLLVNPTEHPAGRRTWRQQVRQDLVAYGLLIPKVAGKCEDAPPLLVHRSGDAHSPLVVAVLDGMGGAGAGPVSFEIKSFDRGIETTEALFASRVARRGILKTPFQSSTLDYAERLKDRVNQLLKSAVSLLRLGEKSRLRGTITKRLPTTLVATRVSSDSSSGESTITTWWAGDSRCFVVTPTTGLVALTSDHVRIHDPLEQLRSDPPIENVVNCSTDFYLEQFDYRVREPYVLLLATDGVFGYLPTPGYLEFGLLEGLMAGDDFTEQFSRFCSRFAADDVSAAVLVSGFTSKDELVRGFEDRLRLLRERYSHLETLLEAGSDVHDEADRLWELERSHYLSLRGDSRE